MPPIQQRPQRPRRPLRRRRPQVEYYYDDDEYEDDYVEERLNRRRKPVRARTRRPADYDDYGAGQGRRYSDDVPEKRPSSFVRDRIRASDDDYDEPAPLQPAPRNRNRPSAAANGDGRRNNNNDERPERRRNQNDDRFDRRPAARPAAGRKRPADRQPLYDDEPVVTKPKKMQRTTTQPPPPRYEDEDYDDDYVQQPSPRQPIVDDDTPKVRPSGSGSSIYSRPRAPPRINRPVPINDKKKFEYMPKETAPSSAPAYDDEEDYDYEAAPASAAAAAPPPPPPQRAIANEKSESKYVNQRVRQPTSQLAGRQQPQKYQSSADDEDSIVRGQYKYIYNKHDSKGTLSKGNNNPRIAAVDEQSQPQQQRQNSAEEYEEEPEEYELEEEQPAAPPPPPPPPPQPSVRPSKIKSSLNFGQQTTTTTQSTTTTASVPGAFTQRPTMSDVYKKFRNNVRTTKTTERSASVDDVNDDEYVDESDGRKSPRRPATEVRDPEVLPFKTKYHRFSTAKDVRYSALSSRVVADQQPEHDGTLEESTDLLPSPATTTTTTTIAPRTKVETVHHQDDDNSKEQRPVVRVVKRPFLPSRGGNPYLPRGLKPLGTAAEISSDEYEEQPTGPATIAGPLLIYHNPPRDIVSTSSSVEATNTPVAAAANPLVVPSTTTTEPVIESPRTTLEKIYNSEYDVTLNDALNPTLKPLTPSRSSPIGFSRRYYPENAYAADISNAPSLIHSSIVQPAALPLYGVQAQAKSSPAAVHEYYDDYDY